jgi:RHS repeat-associated protein
VLRQVAPNGKAHTCSYGPLSAGETDEEGKRTRRLLDATGRVASVEQRLGARTLISAYEYDLKGNLVRHTDPAGNEVRFAYDLLSRTLRIDRPEHGSSSVLDAAGNAVEARPRTGQKVLREFDECGRPVALRVGSPAAAPRSTFRYHDAGRPAPPEAGAYTVGRCVRIDDEGGATVVGYDARGRLATKACTPTSSVRSYELRFEYRADNQVARVVYPDDAAGDRLNVEYRYDVRGNISAVPSLVSAIERDLRGRRTRARYANGVEARWSYDALTDRLRTSELRGPAGVLRSVALTLDGAGNPTRIDSPDPRLAATYLYDDLYRLAQATTDAGQNWTYRYDDANNLTFKSDLGDLRFGEGGQPGTLQTSAAGAPLTWSALGELQQAPWGMQAFDALGRLSSVARTGGGTSAFTYDYAGTRVAARTVAAGGAISETLTPDPLFSVEGGKLVVNLFDGEGLAGRQSRGAAGRWLHCDHLGNVVAATDGAGALVDEIHYDPYGRVISRTGAGAPFATFGGGRPDDSGLVLLGARYYAPSLGIFVSPDVVVADASDPFAWNPYGYCRGNPVAYADPTGRDFWGILIAALAIVALIVVTVICVVLDVFTFGAMTPLLAVGIIALGVVVGGIIGGIAAWQKGGNTEDIITGILVGAAVGGWASFATVFAGGGAAGALGLHGIWAGVVAGAVNGAISGAAMGFAAGYAGGKGTLDEIWTKVWQGALIGAITGAILGGISAAITPPKTSPLDDAARALQPDQPVPPPAGAPPAPATGAVPPGYTNDFGQALQTGLGGSALRIGGAAALNVFLRILPSPLTQAFITDTVVGVWDLGYAKALLEKIGVIKVGGSF